MSTTWALPSARPATNAWPTGLKCYAGIHGLWLASYAFLGKGFAYAGWAPFYVTELLMLVGIAALVASGALGTLVKSRIGILATLFALWQLACTLPYLQTYGVDSFRDGALWGYSAFAWITAALVLKLRRFLHLITTETFRKFAWAFVLIGPLMWVASLFFRDSLPQWPGTAVSIPLIKGGEYCVHLGGILAFTFSGLTRRGPWMWLILADAMLGMGVRGGFLAFLIAGLFVMLLRPRLLRIVLLGITTLMVVVIMATFEIRFTIPGMARELSLDQLQDSVQSVIGSSERMDLEGTKAWRLAWWSSIRDYTINGPYFWQGKGYGINLADSDGFQVGNPDELLRSPHNSHLTFLARSGVPGFVLWLTLQLAWLFAMLRGYLMAHRLALPLWPAFFAWMSSYWIAFTVSGSFDVFLEGPMAAVPFWSLFGIGWGGYLLFQRVAHAGRTAG